ncbi:MAG: hypothetical protein EPO09_02465 [Aquabacterium sp.]|uniref:hypothetical protein n=1 Tax=Aquabacterium sp. TaxID=1872578 RepID=UPI00121826AC|nr:hypothetical protein [Aquabacterium sp.]TAK98364.1 MAG: hypothetical protein EPO09_02465 [Aquabacterium sp.]
MAERRFLLFSGHNDRAVVALCRFFEQVALPFVIVAAGKADAIHRTKWASQVAFNRLDAVVTVEWLRLLTGSLGGELVYCPTTEFINHFVLTHREALAGCGLHIGLPDRAIYEALTGKHSSQALMTGLCADLQLPATQPDGQWHAPCVLKPRENVRAGRVLYPVLCPEVTDLQHALSVLDRSSYFAQDFIKGQSHYLCAYLARNGEFASFWQVNLMQQGGGKSIVLAQPCANPGLDEASLFRGLHERGYHGAFMLEVIAAQGRLHYIEVNPRFWGPLQLALDVCPDILSLFAREQGFDTPAIVAQRPENACYAWAYGAQQPGVVVHPAGLALDARARERRLLAHDVYARDDTRALQACY